MGQFQSNSKKANRTVQSDSPLLHLQPELLYLILEYLDSDELLCCSMICKPFHLLLYTKEPCIGVFSVQLLRLLHLISNPNCLNRIPLPHHSFIENNYPRLWNYWGLELTDCNNQWLRRYKESPKLIDAIAKHLILCDADAMLNWKPLREIFPLSCRKILEKKLLYEERPLVYNLFTFSNTFYEFLQKQSKEFYEENQIILPKNYFQHIDFPKEYCTPKLNPYFLLFYWRHGGKDSMMRYLPEMDPKVIEAEMILQGKGNDLLLTYYNRKSEEIAKLAAKPERISQ